MKQKLPASPTSIEELKQLTGVMLGPTQWHRVEQAAVNAFADVTHDHQWIHIDEERAANGPFGATVAHGLLTLSLGPALTAQLVTFEGFEHSVNYGYEKVRFPAPVLVGSRIRMSATIESVDVISPQTAHLIINQTIEVEGGTKPACVALAVGRLTEARPVS